MQDVLTVIAWIVLGVPAALAVTVIAGRLLGVRRGWIARLGDGILGWTLGVVIAGVLSEWQWSSMQMVGLTLLFGTLLTMIFSVGFDMLRPPGSLAHGAHAGLVSFRTPGQAWRATIAPIGRYRELIRLARVNGLLSRRPNLDDTSAIAALGPPLRRTLEDAGGMFVKLGQVASTRSDLLPPELCAELALLRSSATPAPHELVEPLVEDELGASVDTVFDAFDWNPIASASVAQVYAATVAGGDNVVVKVERPGIEEVVERDSAVLYQVAGALERHTTLGLSIKPTEIADEFIAGVREELDFTIEAANARALAAATPAGSGVRLPRVYPEHSTARVLVEERVDGVSIADVDTLRAQGQDPSALADRLLRVFLTHIFEAGVFHADPHPGNILVEGDGTIVLIDLGAIGRLGKQQQQLFVQLLAGATTGDATAVREALDDAGVIEGNVNSSDLDAAIDQFLARNLGKGAGLSSSIFEELFTMLAAYGIRPPRWMTTLGRTFVTLDGTLRCIDPTFSLIDTAMSVATQHVHHMVRPESLKDAMQAEATRQLPRLRRLPQRIDDLLGQASRGRLTARVSLFADKDDIDTITRLVDRVVLAILAAALGIGSVLLLHVETGPLVSDSVSVNEVLGYIGLALSTILTLRIVGGIIRDGLT